MEGSISDVINYIKNLEKFSDYPVAKFAPEHGHADIVAKKVKDKVKVTQLRKLFTQIKQIELELKGKNSEEDFKATTKIYLLLPELAYALGRKLITPKYYNLMKECFDVKKLKRVKDFNRLVEFLTAVLAYHKKVIKN